MGVRGHYVLDLQCDERSCDKHSVVKAEEKNIAVQEARKQGWIIGTLTKCPTCVHISKELRLR